jgi:hypothetical protein
VFSIQPYLVIILQVGENFASRCTLQVSEAALVKTEGLADEALRLLPLQKYR